MHLLLHDYANYAFTKQLASQLAQRGMQVTYAYNSRYDGPNSKAELVATPGLEYLPIGVGGEGKTTKSILNRFKMERSYAKAMVESLKDTRFDAVLSANVPSMVQNRLVRLLRSMDVPLFTWVQDLYGVAAHRILRKRLPVIGELVGRYFIRLDQQSLRWSEQAILITEDFRPFAREAGLPDGRIQVVENWAPVRDIPVMSKDNPWARAQKLPNVFRFVYSGTLAMKHNPQLLVQLAQSLQEHATRTSTPAAELLVVSSSSGAAWLAGRVNELGLKNVRLMDFQPAGDFPAILGSADVLLAVLESDAAAFSVPSKVLSYLCAGKPILAAIPAGNLAARIIGRADAGLVVDPTVPTAFAAAGVEMMCSEPSVRHAWGTGARDYAERTFDPEVIADRFWQILMPMQAATTSALQI